MVKQVKFSLWLPNLLLEFWEKEEIFKIASMADTPLILDEWNGLPIRMGYTRVYVPMEDYLPKSQSEVEGEGYMAAVHLQGIS